MAAEINPFIQTLIDFGVAQILTFVLMLTLSYAILRQTKVFGDPENDDKTNTIYMILSIVIAFLIYISPVGQGIDLWFSKYFLHILIVLVTVLGAVMLIGMSGHSIGGDNPLIPSRNIALIIGAVIAFAIFLNAGGFHLFGINHPLIPGESFFNVFDNIKITSETIGSLLAVLVILAIVALPIWLIVSELGFTGSRGNRP